MYKWAWRLKAKWAGWLDGGWLLVGWLLTTVASNVDEAPGHQHLM